VGENGVTDMNASSDDRDVAQYLLGRLPPGEREVIEERLFTDDSLHERFETAADDLIHAYLSGELPEQERADFESHFLASPRRRERLAFVRDLASAVDRMTPPAALAPVPPPTRESSLGRWHVLATAASVLLASALAVLLLRTPRAGPERIHASPLPSLAPSSPLPPEKEPLEALQPASPEASIRTVRLPHVPPARPTAVRLSAAARIVRLEVVVEDGGPPSYDAVVRKADGSEAWRAEGLAPSRPGQPLVLPIPADVLSAADYVLSVEGEALRNGGQEAGRLEYRLHIVREP
jgi:anti-sigma factor RsiW